MGDWRDIALTGQMVKPLRSYYMLLGAQGSRAKTASVECSTEEWNEVTDDSKVKVMLHPGTDLIPPESSYISFARTREVEPVAKRAASQGLSQRSSMNVQDQEGLHES